MFSGVYYSFQSLTLVCKLLEFLMSIERCMAMTYFRHRPKTNTVLSHPKRITLCVTICALLFTALRFGAFTFGWSTFVQSSTGFLQGFSRLVEVSTLITNLILLVAIVKYQRETSSNRVNPIQHGATYLRNRLMVTSSKLVVFVAMMSVFLAAPTLGFIVYKYLDGKDVINDPDVLGVYFMINVLSQSVSCLNFFIYLIGSKPFRIALKKAVSFFRNNRTFPLLHDKQNEAGTNKQHRQVGRTKRVVNTIQVIEMNRFSVIDEDVNRTKKENDLANRFGNRTFWMNIWLKLVKIWFIELLYAEKMRIALY